MINQKINYLSEKLFKCDIQILNNLNKTKDFLKDKIIITKTTMGEKIYSTGEFLID